MNHYRELLRKYMEHVLQSEGITFVGNLNFPPSSDVRFSDDERGVLEQMARDLGEQL